MDRREAFFNFFHAGAVALIEEEARKLTKTWDEPEKKAASLAKLASELADTMLSEAPSLPPVEDRRPVGWTYPDASAGIEEPR